MRSRRRRKRRCRLPRHSKPARARRRRERATLTSSESSTDHDARSSHLSAASLPRTPHPWPLGSPIGSHSLGATAFLERLDRSELRHARNNGWGVFARKSSKAEPSKEAQQEAEMSEEEALALIDGKGSRGA